MSESDAAERAVVQAAHREYQHQRDCLLQHLRECGAVTKDKAARGKLTDEDHYGSEFDTANIEDATRAFLNVSDVRMQDGSDAEKIALAELLTQFRRLLPISPLTTTLAEVAGRAAEIAEVRAVRGAEVRGAESARDSKAVFDEARIVPRLAIIAPLVREGQRKAEAAGERFSLKGLLADVNVALVAALKAGTLRPRRPRDPISYPEISEATLRRDVDERLNPTG